MIANDKIIKAQQLTTAIRDELEALAQICRQSDGLSLTLYLEDPRLARQETNQFLYYQDDILVGMVTLPAGNQIEIMGMVHPEYRCRGIGRALLNAAVAECQHRGVQECLLVCEGGSPAGQQFIEAVGGTYCFSEYAMALDREAFAHSQRDQDTITLHQATDKDLDVLVSLRVASIADQTALDVCQMTQNYLQRTDQRYFIGTLNAQPIGMLRVDENGPTVGIYAFVVLPEHRGRGYGRQILLKTLDKLVSEDWQTIMLEVETENRNALKLYERCGFQETTQYDYYHLSV